ncbi:tripartite tricarboxylate transporter permease [Marinibaculum pumilum]|uniref:Tripartite tricarboxylate transporter permease n=1 Tax=Marinibaculum pumilum TaxID=1766165 RepID=A0ABV7KZM6_9PROT
MEQLLAALPMAFEPMVLAMAAAGLVIGIVIGAIPGLNVPLAVAVALPVTFSLEPLAGLAMLVGIYKGGTYAGSLSAVLIGIPGTPAAAATALDGAPLMRAGQAGKALKMSLYASIIGSFISDLALIFFALPMAMAALSFGPAENFALGIFSLTLIAVLSEGMMLKGLISGALGIFLATFGIDPLTGDFRLTFGVTEISAGWNFIALVMGVFAVAEGFAMVERKVRKGEAPAPVARVRLSDPDHSLTRAEWRASAPSILRSAPIGVAIGAVPGLGSAIAAFLTYGLARTFSRDPGRFGKGAVEGVAAAETGNSSVTSSTFIPLLTLGIPGDVITAIMLGAFMIHGLVPGPTLFTESGDFVTAYFVVMVLTTLLHLVIGRAGMSLFIQAVRVPTDILFPVVLLLCFTGVYVATNSFFDLYVMLGFGLLGYGMNKLGFPVAPLLIGFILGPLVEVGMRQSLILSRGSLDIFIDRPIAGLFLGMAAITLAWVGWRELRGPRAPKKTEAETGDSAR